jgi:hypothetical protein
MSDPTIDAAVGATLNGQAAAIRNSVNDALPVNPDAEAATRRYAAAANVPLDTARQMPDAVKQQAQMSTFNADVLARKFPTTAQLVANPDLARITHDDIPATAAVEQAVQAPSVEQHPAQNPLPGKAWTVGRVADYLASADGEHGLIFDAGSGVMSLLKGLGGTFNKLAEGVNTVLGSAPVLYDKAAGTEHADWWFRNMVDPAVEHEGAFALGPDATFADKGAHAAGSLLGTIAQIVLSGGAGAEAAVPAAADSVAGAVGSAAAHGVKSMALPALNEAVNTGREVYQTTGGDGQAAFKAAAAAYGTTSAMGVMPLSASGGLFTRAITGGVSGLATGEANRRVMNAALPDSMQTQFNWEDAFMNAATGSVLGGVLGPRTSTPGAAKAVRDTYTETYQAAKTEAQAQQLTDIAKAASCASAIRKLSSSSWLTRPTAAACRTSTSKARSSPRSCSRAASRRTRFASRCQPSLTR